MKQSKLFWRFVWRALRRQARSRTILIAVCLGTAILTAMMNIYLDLNAKLSQELRAYGANMLLTPGPQQKSLDLNKLRATLSTLSKDKLTGYAPYLYGIVSVTKAGNFGSLTLQNRALLVGTNLNQMLQVKPYMALEGTVAPTDDSALIGTELAKSIRVTAGDSISVDTEKGKTETFIVSAVITTGGEEDEQLFVPLAQAQALLARPGEVDAAALSVAGGQNAITEVSNILTQSYPGITVSAMGQVVRSEAKVLSSLAMLVLLMSLIMVLATLLCLLITMVIAVNERRGEIGLKKALGADTPELNREFMAEAFVLGLSGGFLGIAVGWALTGLIGQIVFQEGVSFKWTLAPLTLVIGALITAAAALYPVLRIAAVKPIDNLRTE